MINADVKRGFFVALGVMAAAVVVGFVARKF